MRIEQISGNIGAEISDINLASVTDHEVEEIKKAWLDHKVLVYRNQHITVEEHIAFGRKFGELEIHPFARGGHVGLGEYPEILRITSNLEKEFAAVIWHSDVTWREEPSLGSILRGVAIPETGGDTMFSSLSKAYDDLSHEWKERLEEMNAIHSFEFGFKESLEEEGGRERLADALKENPPVSHPVIKQHPVTGRKVIYVNRLFTSHIEGDDAESSILNFLFDHIHQEKYQYRFSWENNSIAFWDNRSVLHKPVNDYWPQLRRMERITIES